MARPQRAALCLLFLAALGQQLGSAAAFGWGGWGDDGAAAEDARGGAAAAARHSSDGAAARPLSGDGRGAAPALHEAPTLLDIDATRASRALG
jgi:hypothetical protein